MYGVEFADAYTKAWDAVLQLLRGTAVEAESLTERMLGDGNAEDEFLHLPPQLALEFEPELLASLPANAGRRVAWTLKCFAAWAAANRADLVVETIAWPRALALLFSPCAAPLERAMADADFYERAMLVIGNCPGLDVAMLAFDPAPAVLDSLLLSHGPNCPAVQRMHRTAEGEPRPLPPHYGAPDVEGLKDLVCGCRQLPQVAEADEEVNDEDAVEPEFGTFDSLTDHMLALVDAEEAWAEADSIEQYTEALAWLVHHCSWEAQSLDPAIKTKWRLHAGVCAKQYSAPISREQTEEPTMNLMEVLDCLVAMLGETLVENGHRISVEAVRLYEGIDALAAQSPWLLGHVWLKVRQAPERFAPLLEPQLLLQQAGRASRAARAHGEHRPALMQHNIKVRAVRGPGVTAGRAAVLASQYFLDGEGVLCKVLLEFENGRHLELFPWFPITWVADESGYTAYCDDGEYELIKPVPEIEVDRCRAKFIELAAETDDDRKPLGFREPDGLALDAQLEWIRVRSLLLDRGFDDFHFEATIDLIQAKHQLDELDVALDLLAQFSSLDVSTATRAQRCADAFTEHPYDEVDVEQLEAMERLLLCRTALEEDVIVTKQRDSRDEWAGDLGPEVPEVEGYSRWRLEPLEDYGRGARVFASQVAGDRDAVIEWVGILQAAATEEARIRNR